MEIISRYIDKNKTQVESGTVRVRGVYEKSNDFDSAAHQWAFDKLTDEMSGASLKILVAKPVRDFINDGDTVVMSGTISDYAFPDSGTLQVQMRVTGCEQAKDLFVPKIENDKHRLRRKKTVKGYRDVTRMLSDMIDKKSKPRIVMIYPSYTVADTDMSNALGEAGQYYQIERRNVAFSNPAEVVRLLAECDKSGLFDLICIVRGGGSGLQNIDDIDVLAQVVDMNTPVLAALGHAEDNLFINALVDISKDTPTALGHYLRKIASDRLRIEKMIEEKDRKYDWMLSEKSEQLRSLKKAVIILATILGIAVVSMILLVLKR